MSEAWCPTLVNHPPPTLVKHPQSVTGSHSGKAFGLSGALVCYLCNFGVTLLP
jgi:hypothetical protein